MLELGGGGSEEGVWNLDRENRGYDGISRIPY
jgi:hypothetical protein